ncbi:MAG: asparagine synthase-related protein [Candidatus Thorarchaeota archaeon]
MTGIAGIEDPSSRDDVRQMLELINHRGNHDREIYQTKRATLGVVWSRHEMCDVQSMQNQRVVWDAAGSCHFARIDTIDERITLMRDKIGVVPLYYGKTESGKLCFASEIKAILPLTKEVKEFPRGAYFDGKQCRKFEFIDKKKPLDLSLKKITSKLRELLSNSVKKSIGYYKSIGAWLSGGLDSSIMSALASQYVDDLHTFSVGFRGSEDVLAARHVAEHIGSKHHETIVNLDDLVEVLPDVIYHLESFDALLVRSSMMNYLVSKESAKYVDAVFSGEGADELFAGYDYIKSLDPRSITTEVVDITKRLHNTALQRVDRCAAAHGISALVRFLDPQFVDFALRIPSEYKMFNGVEKWILRESMRDFLPEEIISRAKSKFWEGAGVVDKIAEMTEDSISDYEFKKECTLANGWILNTKEELFYYRIFENHFGILDNLSWMGRTKGVPRASSNRGLILPT